MKKILYYIAFFLSQTLFAQSLPNEQQATITVLATENSRPVLVKVQHKEDNKVEILGLGKDTEEAKNNLMKYLEEDLSTSSTLDQPDSSGTTTFRLVSALRLKFADLVGIRIGLQITDYFEVGWDAGTSIIVTQNGAYATGYPFARKDNGWRGSYVSARAYATHLFALLAIGKTTSGEVVLGYKFDKKPGRLYSFLEAGVNHIAKDYTSSTGVPASLEKSITYPVIGVGVGWSFNLRK